MLEYQYEMPPLTTGPVARVDDSGSAVDPTSDLQVLG
jgi:hypothetical protein